ncbi:MAG: 16S rRNA (guanine(527)-N(7))-methyltransferase RsmG [Oscillospiraceae bacterium]|nr:16S rRNA (guanine(527)-N(7))-methyltransferase RsmG [Oscillospiraceae bacterium]
MLEDILREGFAAMSLDCGPEQLSQFRAYYDFLTERGAVMNLTAITGEAETARLHFLDSAAPLRRFSMDGASLIDIGSGAGFPGVVLKLLCPSLRLTLLDSQRKRVDFLRQLCDLLGLRDVICVHTRAESPGALRESFDYAASRAVAQMNLLAELCLPYVRPGGVFLALKGPAAGTELAEAKRALSLLGGTVEAVYDEYLPGGDERRSLVAVRKQRPTPIRYPRPYAQIKKTPL